MTTTRRRTRQPPRRRADAPAVAAGTERSAGPPSPRVPPRASLRHAGALLLTLSVLACGSPDETAAQGADPEVERIKGRSQWDTDFSKRTVPLSEIRSGGPPKDGIPSIDDPKFVGPAKADGWLEAESPVMVVELEGEAKAYPLSILISHEIVNDRIAGRPVLVTYCPLCNTALAFDRKVEGRVLDFGTTGRLRHSDLVMYDRQTETWWQQASGEAIIGDLVGTTLEFLPANVFSWKKARELYPEIRALSRETGYARNYGSNPYAGYDRPGRQPIGQFLTEEPDDRLPPLERVAALDLGEGWAAPFSRLEEVRVVNATVEGKEVAVFWAPGAASALDARRVSEGRDVGQTAAFSRRLEGRTLAFEWRDGAFRDRETGSTWDMAGRATSGPLQGKRLEPVTHGNHFWFAWAVFRPDTEIWKGEKGDG